MTPEILAEVLSSTVRNAFLKKGLHPDMCMHTPDKAAVALKEYCISYPDRALIAVTNGHRGDKSLIDEIIRNAMSSGALDDCEDVICLVCRRSRMMNRTMNSHRITQTPELVAMAKFLGDDVMQSIKWVTNILSGTIESKKSSESHKKKAELARNTMIPSLIASAAMVHGLQQDLAQAIEDRDKYHKLADFLMDGESDPAS